MERPPNVPARPIWARRPSVDQLNDLNTGSMAGTLGIRMVEVGDDFLRASMPVDARTVQPYGILHGGASVTLAETLGSVASHFCIANEEQVGVGLTIDANHVRSVPTGGQVTGTARALHLGRSTHVWQIRIEDERGRLVCVSRLTVAIIERRTG